MLYQSKERRDGALQELRYSVSNNSEVLQSAKDKTGRKIVGVFHSVVPEELIYAAGLHPTRLFAHFDEPITLADAHMQTFFCSNVRAIWDQVLKGKYPYLNGVVIPTACEAVDYIYQTWKRHNPYEFVTSVVLPFKKTENALSFLAAEIGRLKKSLEGFTGREISSDSLHHAIELYNKNRELLKKLYELRKSESPPLCGVDAYYAVMSGFILDKEQHNVLLEQLLGELQSRSDSPRADVRLLVSGGCMIDVRVLEAIESLGAVIVADDTNTGSRSFWHQVDAAKDPLSALASRCMAVPSPFTTSSEERLQYISEMIREYRVDGVVFAIQKYCESEKFDLPFLEGEIRGRFGVPTTYVETDYLADIAPLKTRVEAFIESLKAV